jgi:hypothetical protein
VSSLYQDAQYPVNVDDLQPLTRAELLALSADVAKEYTVWPSCVDRIFDCRKTRGWVQRCDVESFIAEEKAGSYAIIEEREGGITIEYDDPSVDLDGLAGWIGSNAARHGASNEFIERAFLASRWATPQDVDDALASAEAYRSAEDERREAREYDPSQKQRGVNVDKLRPLRKVINTYVRTQYEYDLIQDAAIDKVQDLDKHEQDKALADIVAAAHDAKARYDKACEDAFLEDDEDAIEKLNNECDTDWIIAAINSLHWRMPNGEPLEVGPAPQPKPEEIWDEPGHEEANRQAIQRQIAANPEMFNRDGVLVRLHVPESKLADGTEWQGDMPGTTIAKPADIMLCAERLAWMKTGNKGPYRVHPPRPFVGEYIPQVGGQGARPLRGLTRLPHIDDYGVIRCFSGYNRKTGLYNDRPIKLDVPSVVSRDEARELVKPLLYPFSLYMFKDQKAGEAAVLAAIFTALERAQLPLAPMFIPRCPMSGTGKGKLARAITTLALGSRPAMMTYGGGVEEFEKRLAGLLLQTPSAIVIDNANGVMVRSALLESILSEGYADIRPLGSSEITRIYSRAFLALTGCSPVITGDMARRALAIDVLPGSTDPERKLYAFDPVGYIQEHRKELLEAAFTVMRAYRYAEMPQPKLPAVGSFAEWARKVRDLVYWVTDYDVGEGFHSNKAEDPRRQNDAALLAALYAAHWDEALVPRTKEFKGTDVIDMHSRVKNHVTIEPGQEIHDHAVYDALNEVFDESKRKVTPKNFGYWARSVSGAYHGDFVLRLRQDKHLGANVYWVECTDPEKAKERPPGRGPMDVVEVEVSIMDHERQLANLKEASAKLFGS